MAVLRSQMSLRICIQCINKRFTRAHTQLELPELKAELFTTPNCHRFTSERNLLQNDESKLMTFKVSRYSLTSADSSSSSDWSPTPMSTIRDTEGNRHNSFDILMGPAVRTRLPSINRRIYPSASTSSDD
jgi:hypothetical protein